MRFPKLLTVFVLGMLIFASCKTAKAPVAEQAPVAEEIVDDTYRRVIKSKDLYASTTETVGIDSAKINRDTLHVFTSKLQACDAENLSLIWDGKESATPPRKASLKLLLINEPGCRETHRFHLLYNIAGLHAKKPIAADTMLLQLTRVKQPLQYTY